VDRRQVIGAETARRYPESHICDQRHNHPL